MGIQFYHGFKTSLGPFTHRETYRSIPTGRDCSRIVHGYVSIGIKKDPLRTGHLWCPPEDFQVTEGYIETRARFRGHPGAHGAVWLQDLLPYYDADRHEVDIVEYFGNHFRVHQGIWTETDGDPEPEQVLHSTVKIFPMDWHIYGCEMRKDGYTFTVDGNETISTNYYGSNHPKYLVLSMLISPWELARYGYGNKWGQRAHVDWIRVTDL